MIQKQLGLFAILILATIMISSPILPGYAAEKVETIQGPFEVNPRVSACGGSWGFSYPSHNYNHWMDR